MKSLSVGTSGSASVRAVVVTARARSLPAFTCPSDVAISVKATWICPPIRSVTAGAAAIRNMGEIGAGHQLEIFADHMGQRAVAAGAHRDLAGIGLGVGDELENGFGGNGRIDLHELRHAHDAADRRGVADEVKLRP